MGQSRPARGDGRDAKDAGAAALEFALVSPLLFALLFMIFSAGWSLWEYQAARATAREAVRLASVGIPDGTAFGRGVACLGERNGLRPGALAGIQLSFHATSLLDGLEGGVAQPGGYVEVRLTYTSALSGVLPSPFTDDQGRFTTGAVARIEQLGRLDLASSGAVPVSQGTCG